jgi:riboflavin synthase
VTEFDTSKEGGYFKIGAAPETLKKTNLGKLKVGNKVNCERAMQAHTRFGGHFVQGHVDTTAVLQSVVPTGNALTLTLRLSLEPDSLPLPSSLSPYLIAKGYVTLDGASLTLIDVSPATGGSIQKGNESSTDDNSEVVEFSVMLIRHTQEVIGLSAKKAGDLVNVELDVSSEFAFLFVCHQLTRSYFTDGGKIRSSSCSRWLGARKAGESNRCRSIGTGRSDCFF